MVRLRPGGIRRPALLAAAIAAGCAAGAARARPAEAPHELVVTAPAPLGGAAIDPDKLPWAVQAVSAATVRRAGSLSVVDALAQGAAGLTLTDPQGNGFTRDVNFRGFASSPLQGAPQGLAVYLDGVRLNEAFGDTVNWDLIPETAIAQAEVLAGDPAFGLNALGGAVALTMKTGRDAPGGAASLEGGSFGRVDGEAEYGASAGPWSIYLAGDGEREDGWRRDGESSLARAYADLGWTGAGAEAHLKLLGGVTRLGAAGPTPADLLAIDRRAVFTTPQTTSNHALLAALEGRLDAGRGWTLTGDVYLRRFNQHHLDGNDGDFASCGGDPADPLFGTLCVDSSGFPVASTPPAEAFQVLGEGGAPIPCPAGASSCDDVPYGSLDRTRTDATSWGGAVQASTSAEVGGRANLFTAGASLDLGRARFSASSRLAVIRPDLSVGPDPAVPGTGQTIRTAGAVAYSPVELNADVTAVGVYASDTLDLTRRLSLTVSGRFNVVSIRTGDLTGISPELNGRHSFTRLNPAAGLAYRLSPALTVYGGYAEASRAPTPLELGCSDPVRPCLLENALVADPPLRQVVARTWEAGIGGLPMYRADGSTGASACSRRTTTTTSWRWRARCRDAATTPTSRGPAGEAWRPVSPTAQRAGRPMRPIAGSRRPTASPPPCPRPTAPSRTPTAMSRCGPATGSGAFHPTGSHWGRRYRSQAR